MSCLSHLFASLFTSYPSVILFYCCLVSLISCRVSSQDKKQSIPEHPSHVGCIGGLGGGTCGGPIVEVMMSPWVSPKVPLVVPFCNIFCYITKNHKVRNESRTLNLTLILNLALTCIFVFNLDYPIMIIVGCLIFSIRHSF